MASVQELLSLGCSPCTGDQRALVSLVKAGQQALTLIVRKVRFGSSICGVLASPRYVTSGIWRGAEVAFEWV